jgi:prepilin-type N-terminal cleavage/methylation domain-containing protein
MVSTISPKPSHSCFFVPARGFTLIELLAGMAVLSILILVMAQFVNVGTDAWEHGMRQSESSTSARAALDYLAAELSTAIANDHVTFRHNDKIKPTYYQKLDDYNDRLLFVSVSRKPDETGPTPRPRAGIEVGYYLREMKASGPGPGTLANRYELVRSFRASTNSQFKAYRYAKGNGPDWTDGWQPSGQTHTIAENISGFQVWVYPDVQSGSQPGFYSGSYSNSLPVWADIYLETLSETDAKRAALITDPGLREVFVRKWSRGYTTRVHFKNRKGYIRRS